MGAAEASADDPIVLIWSPLYAPSAGVHLAVQTWDGSQWVPASGQDDWAYGTSSGEALPAPDDPTVGQAVRVVAYAASDDDETPGRVLGSYTYQYTS